MSNKSTIVRFIQTVAPTASVLAPRLSARALQRLFTTPMRWPTPERERPWIARAHRGRVPIDAHRQVATYTWGDEGPTVLLVHGWAGRASQLGVFAAPLRERGFRVVAFDAPGHGDADGKRSALPEFVTAVQRVAQHVGPLHAIVGHSLGAASTTIALHRGLRVHRAVFIAPPERPGRYLERAASWLGFSHDVARGTQTRLERHYGVKFDDMRGSELAPGLRTPLLVIHDPEDDDVPYSEGRRLAEAWPGAQLMTVHGLGHRRILRDAAVVEATVDFVGREDGRQAAVG
jgi:pimeloyl-ACP methyl ester carboxylesterase